MRVLFVGLGSIGTRHLRDFAGIMRSEGIEFRCEALRSSESPLPPDVARDRKSVV